MTGGYRIEPLDLARHDRRHFDCGEPALNEYLRRFAGQHARSNLSRTFVAADENHILGYYSLAGGAIQQSNLPSEHEQRFPNYPLPVVRLARLAVTREAQGRGIGQDLLVDALLRTRRMALEAGIIGIVVDAKHEHAATFYQHHEFEPLQKLPRSLWLPLTAIESLLRNS